MRHLVQFFKALSDETRLKIVALLLCERELCVCDIEHVLDLTQSKASRHLRYLLHSGVLIDERKGIWVYYSLSDSLDAVERSILDSLRGHLSDKMWLELKQKLDAWLSSKKDTNLCSGGDCE